jgi:hypothetical protein
MTTSVSDLNVRAIAPSTAYFAGKTCKAPSERNSTIYHRARWRVLFLAELNSPSLARERRVREMGRRQPRYVWALDPLPYRH